MNNVTPTLRKMMRGLSDHQIIGFIDVMMLDNHCIDDATATYVAAHDEGMKRPAIKHLIESRKATT